jgi:hypothetical protein
LVFLTPDEANLATAREVMRKAIAWASIEKDGRLQQQMTKAQAADALDKAKSNRDAALKAVRAAWSHIFVPVRSETPGKPFDLEHSLISARDRAAIPTVVYDKAKADGIALERLGSDRLWLALKPIWPNDRPHLPISEIVEWFAAYVYLPKLRDRVVLEAAIKDSVAKLDPQFGFADSYDEASGKYHKLVWAKNPPEFIATTAVLVRDAEALAQIRADETSSTRSDPVTKPTTNPSADPSADPKAPSAPRMPKRFYGSVEIDMVRPVKSFDAVLNAVVMELQRTHGAKVKITVEIEAEAADGFSESDVGVVRDNARQLKFRAESTGFEE